MIDLHTHTVFSDGKNTAEEMVEAAISLGMEAIGFTDHSYTPFDPDIGIAPGREEEYRRTVRALKEKYRDRITVFLGIEQDYHTEGPAADVEYIIGSVHYVCRDGIYRAVDDTRDVMRDAIDRLYHGDAYALVEDYFASVADIAKTNPDIIGHFDLVRKLNPGNVFFDEDHPRYKNAAGNALDKLLPLGIPFEINTGAMSRGHLATGAYPAKIWRDYIREKGGTFILNGDSHTAASLCYAFADYEKEDEKAAFLFKKFGFR